MNKDVLRIHLNNGVFNLNFSNSISVPGKGVSRANCGVGCLLLVDTVNIV